MRRMGGVVCFAIWISLLGCTLLGTQVHYPLPAVSGSSADGVLRLINASDTPQDATICFFLHGRLYTDQPATLTVPPHGFVVQSIGALAVALSDPPAGRPGYLVVTTPTDSVHAEVLLASLPTAPVTGKARPDSFSNKSINPPDPIALYPLYPTAPQTAWTTFFQGPAAVTGTWFLLGNPTATPAQVGLRVDSPGATVPIAAALTLAGHEVRWVAAEGELFNGSGLPDTGVLRLTADRSVLAVAWYPAASGLMAVPESTIRIDSDGRLVPEYDTFPRFGTADTLWLANPGPAPVSLTVDLVTTAGTRLGQGTIDVPVNGFVRRSCEELFDGISFLLYQTHAILRTDAPTSLLAAAVICGAQQSAAPIPAAMGPATANPTWHVVKDTTYFPLTVHNPGAAPATVMVTQYNSSGQVVRQPVYSVAPDANRVIWLSTPLELFWDWYWNRPSLITVTADGPILAWTWHTAITTVGGVPGWGLAPAIADHPIPVLTALEPAAAVAGSADLAVTLHGSGFIPDSLVFADGSPLSVTGQTDTQLTVIIPAADLIQPGAVNVWVENPPPGGGTSASLTLAVVPGVPSITALNPAQVPAGSASVTLRVDGGPFHADSVITLDGTLLSTTYHAGSQAYLTAVLPDGLLTLPGTRGVTVINPGLGGGESAPVVLTVTAGIPSLVALDPAEIPVGSAGVVLRADGGPLYPDSLIRANGADLATTFYAGSPAYLTAVLPDALMATTGVLSITVVNIGPGGGESAPLECQVTAGIPAITALDPAAVLAGSTGVTLQVDGGPFHLDSVVTLDGAILPTDYHPGDPAWLTAAVPAAATALPGLRTVTVINSGLGGGESTPATFTVLAGVPVLTVLDPAQVPAGSTGVVLGVQGAPFYPGSVIRVDGTELATTYHDDSPAFLTAVLPDNLLALPGNLPVTVVNAGPGGGESAPAMLTITGGAEQPVITLLTPAQVTAGSTGVELLVYGRPLDATCLVRIDGNVMAATFHDWLPPALGVMLPDSFTAVGGVHEVVLHNPAVGDSDPVPFTVVDNPGTPVIVSLAPPEVPLGSAGPELTVFAWQVQDGATILLDGVELPTTLIPADGGYPAELTAVLPADVTATTGARAVTVRNPGPPPADSAAVSVQIVDRDPMILDVYPRELPQGGLDIVINTLADPIDSNSIVWVNDIACETHLWRTFDMPPTLDAWVPDALLTELGALQVTVVNPGPPLRESPPSVIQVVAGVPMIAALTPAEVQAGSAGVTLRVDGGPFHADSVVWTDSYEVPTIYHEDGDSIWLTAELDAALLEHGGFLPIQVYNPTPWSLVSEPVALRVLNPAPVLDTAVFEGYLAGYTTFQVRLQGSGFQPAPDGSAVHVDGGVYAPVFESTAELSVVLPVGAAAGGSVDLAVENPAPGGGRSATVTLAVPPVPPLVANAGPVQAVLEGDAVVLDGSASSGPISGYQWEQLSGPAVVLDDATLVQPQFGLNHVDRDALLVFRLTVTDGWRQSQATTSVLVQRRPAVFAIEILSPLEDEAFDTCAVTVTGRILGAFDPTGVSVLVDGQPAALDGDTFTAPAVRLLDGRNRLVATATDRATRNQASAAVTVHYAPPEVDPPVSDTCGWITGTVYSAADRQPLAGARLTVEGIDARLYTDATGAIRFPIADLSDERPARTVVLNITAPEHLDAQRVVMVKRGRYPRVDDVFLVPADPVVSTIPTAGGTAVNSNGRITMDFPAGAVDTPLQVTLTEIPFGDALPNAMPTPSVWTFAFDVTGDTTEVLNLPVRVRVQNFLGFEPGTPIPVGWYNRRAHRWEHDSMSVISEDGLYMEFYITHFSVRDPNAVAPPGDPAPTGPGENPKDECEKIDGGMSEISIDTGNLRISYQTVPYKVMGGDASLTLSYDGKSVTDHFVFTVKVDNTEVIRPDFTTIYLDIADRHYRTTFSSDQAVNYFKIRIPLTDAQGQSLQPGIHPYDCVVENGYRTYNYWSTACFACEPLTDTGVPMREPYRQRVRFSGNFLLQRSDLTHSPYGAGWSLGLNTLKYLHFSADGESIYIQEDSGQPVELHAGMIEKVSGTATDVRPPACQIQPDDSIANNALGAEGMYFHHGELFYNLSLNNPEYCHQLRKVDCQGQLRILIGGGDTDVDWSQTDAIPANLVKNLYLNMSGGGNDFLGHDEQGNVYFASSGGAWNRLFKLDREEMVRLVAIMPMDINELCTDHMGNVYTLSWDYTSQSTVIHKVIANGGVVRIGELQFDTGDFACDLRVDRELNLWVNVNRASGLEIWKVTPAGDAYPMAGYDAAGTAAEAMFEEGVPAAKVKINGILQMFPDSDGNFYYLEYYHLLSEGIWGDRLRKIDAAGQVWTVADFRRNGGLPAGGDDSVMEPFNLNLLEPWSFFFDDDFENIYFMAKNGHLYKMSRQMYAFDSRHRYQYDRLTNQLVDRSEKATWEFDANGHPLACTDRNGNRTEYGWNTQGLLTTITDPLGATIFIRYSAEGYLTEVEDPLGRVTEFVVDGAGDLVRIVQPDLSFLQFEYDFYHRLAAKTMADGSRFRYEYEPDYGTLARVIAPTGELRQYLPALNQGQVLDPDSWTEANPYSADAANMSTVIDGAGHTRYLWTDENGHVLATEDALGQVTLQHPDGRGLVKAVQYPDGSWDEYWYNEYGQLIRMTKQPLGLTRRYFYNLLPHRLTASEDEFGRRTTYEYDEGLNQIEQIDPMNHSTHYTYETNGLLQEVMDPLGHGTHYEYDAYGNVAKVTDPLGHETVYQRDGAGNITAVTDPNGQTTTFSYDIMNRKISQTDPNGQTTTFSYVCAGTNASSCSCCSGESAKVASITDPLGNVTSFEYDGVGNLVRQTDALGHYRSMEYDLNRNLVAVTDEMGRVTRFVYDAANRQTAVIGPDPQVLGGPDGPRTDMDYDAAGRVIARTDPLGRVIRFEYDPAGRLTAQVDALGGRTEFTYDAAGNRTAVTDANGHTTAFTYDALNRLLTETDPLNRIHSRTYDAAGRLSSTTDAEGQTITYDYDAAGRLLTKHYPDATQETYAYDSNGNLLQAINPAVAMSYTYDARNLQLTITNDTIGKTVGYTYDERGRKVALTYPDGETISYTRDSRGQVVHLESDQPGPGGEPPPAVDYAYNADGSLATMDYGFGKHVERIYDPAGRLVDLKYTKPDGTVISDFAYTHDVAGNILSKTTDFGLIQYGYDDLDRLVLADYDWKADETFTYDPVGNRTSSADYPVWQYDAANQLLAYGNGIHDPVGQTPPIAAKDTFSYDANGLTIASTESASGSIDQYKYNYDACMTEFQQNDILVARYYYDHQHQRIRKDTYNEGFLGNSTWYLYGTEGLLAEIDSSGNCLTKYTWQLDNKWSTDLCWKTDGMMNRLFSVNDHLFTTQQLINSACETEWQLDLDAFGGRRIIGDSEENNWGFPGQYYDGESRNYYNFNRFFSTNIGRYLTPDPIGITADYLYSEDNPIIFFDNTGLTLDAVLLRHISDICNWFQLYSNHPSPLTERGAHITDCAGVEKFKDDGPGPAGGGQAPMKCEFNFSTGLKTIALVHTHPRAIEYINGRRYHVAWQRPSLADWDSSDTCTKKQQVGFPGIIVPNYVLSKDGVWRTDNTLKRGKSIRLETGEWYKRLCPGITNWGFK
ncbi:MAG TPA: RHS repeat-associated core domain-containing protein [Acidobacteriota bacterium]|nr:RHS repeat-associated core domain-containing protein [Acidobacteriota bacterium]